MTAPLITVLDWDSTFFGCRVARANLDLLRESDAAGLLAACRSAAVQCLYLLVEANDPGTERMAARHGFRRVDERVTFRREGPLPASDSGVPVRPARVDDLPTLEAIAVVSHTDTRFFADPEFAPRAPELYRTWIAKDIRGGADAVWIAEDSGRPAGYLTCHRDGGGEGRIGLVAVAAAARGRGLGRALVQQGLVWFDAEGIRTVRVVTQSRNAAAARLYEGSGFVVERRQTWYHLWP